MRRLLAVVCRFKGHYNTMVALPEHGWGLYAYSWLGCGRCGRTEDERQVRFAPCWQCPEGKCDRCDDCTTAAGLAHTSHFYPWSEVKAHKRGGPVPRCSRCGEPAR